MTRFECRYFMDGLNIFNKRKTYREKNVIVWKLHMVQLPKTQVLYLEVSKKRFLSSFHDNFNAHTLIGFWDLPKAVLKNMAST